MLIKIKINTYIAISYNNLNKINRNILSINTLKLQLIVSNKNILN